MAGNTTVQIPALTGRLSGKHILLVGAGQTPGLSTGIGRASAVAYASQGAQLHLVDRDRESLLETARLAQLAATVPSRDISCGIFDVSDPQACAALVEQATEAFGGRLDVVHNNVGIGASASVDAGDLSVGQWDQIFAVNLRATWLVCRAAVPRLAASGGVIINVSSLAAISTTGGNAAYKASKAGVNALTQQLAIAHASSGVRVNAIMPGLIDTPMAVDALVARTRRDRAQIVNERADRVPLARQGTAWDIAQAAIFLASDEASFITGVSLPVDGGQSARIG